MLTLNCSLYRAENKQTKPTILNMVNFNFQNSLCLCQRLKMWCYFQLKLSIELYLSDIFCFFVILLSSFIHMAQLKKCVDFTSSKMEVKWGNRLTLFCRVQPLQSRPALCDPMNCSSPGSCVRGILQARILDRIAISSFKGSS